MIKVEFIGYLSGDPDMKYSAEGLPVTTFSVGSHTGGRDSISIWSKVTTFGKQAEASNMYLHKGSKVFIRGTVDIESYLGKDGQPKSQLLVRAHEQEFLTPRSETTQPEGGVAYAQTN